MFKLRRDNSPNLTIAARSAKQIWIKIMSVLLLGIYTQEKAALIWRHVTEFSTRLKNNLRFL
ncbi:hypothetical protein TUM17383_19570 [Shewanella algae]|nr:hypothetical protein TUM17383_19570 [Shewanella algae]